MLDGEATRLPQKDRARPTIEVLQRLGLIQPGIERMGGGWMHSFWRVMEVGRHVLSSSPPHMQ